MTRVEDVQAAVACGVDAVGFIFYPPSPRAVSVSQAKALARAVPAFVTRVGVFVNASEVEIASIINEVSLDVIQFHGDETPERCRRAPRPFIKSIAMREEVDLDVVAQRFQGASALLLDTFHDRMHGGTGQTFDWQRAKRQSAMPIILAGGLNADNVAAALRIVRPFAVDVNGGVEHSPGIKDGEKIKAFVSEVERAQVA